MAAPEIPDRVPTEAEEQERLLQVLRRQGVLFFAVPNGGRRNVREAAAFRRQGVQAGVPDLILPGSDSRWRCLAIELKRSKGGRVSPEQEAWHRLLRASGWRVLVCAGADDAVEQLTGLGVLRKQGLAAERPIPVAVDGTKAARTHTVVDDQ
jgi:hypothetical protein